MTTHDVGTGLATLADGYRAERDEARAEVADLKRRNDNLGQMLANVQAVREHEHKRAEAALHALANAQAEAQAWQRRAERAESEVAAMRQSGSWYQEKDIDRLQAIETDAKRHLEAVRRLGEPCGYNGQSYFDAPIFSMPDEDIKQETFDRWLELNEAGKALRAALSPGAPATGEQP